MKKLLLLLLMAVYSVVSLLAQQGGLISFNTSDVVTNTFDQFPH